MYIPVVGRMIKLYNQFSNIKKREENITNSNVIMLVYLIVATFLLYYKKNM